MAKKPHDDLFEGTSMTFGEHLEELRVCLFRAIAGIAVGCLIGFFIANDVVRFFQSPLERAMERYYLDKAVSDFQLQFGELTHETRTMIVREGLIPEWLQFDVGKLAESLQFTYPERFAGLGLSPYWFTEGDLQTADGDSADEQAQTIAQRLARAKQGRENSPEAALWEALTSDQRKLVESLAAAHGSLSPRQTAELLAVLNNLAGQRELHESAGFQRLNGADREVTAGIRKSLAQRFDPEQSRRLNKLLMAELFEDELKPARINLLSVVTWRPVRVRFQVLNATEAFMIWFKAALMTGLVIASPWVFYQVWLFVAAGLYPHEKNYVYLYLPISFLLFLAGASLVFLFVFDKVLDFLFLFNKGMNADFDPRIGEWLSFVLILPIGFGLSFQLPLVMLFINRLGLVSLETYIAQWRIAVLVIFIIAMILTPAEPISMLMMAGPLCALYLLGILMCKYMPRGRSPFEEAYEP